MEKRKNMTFALLSLLFLAIFTPHKAKAVSVIADTPCDPLYYESLSARAWLEAQREITQNQNLILKPDSVFEYTCFDRLVYELAEHADQMLSGTTSYLMGLNSGSMDGALVDLVGNSLTAYIDGSFGSKSGGGGYSMLANHTSALGIYASMQPVNAAPAYSCDIMGRVWNAAKCMNFITNSASDGFYTFDEYTTSIVDKRHLPTACAPITGNWAGNLTAALTSGNWTNDPVQTYVAETTPQSCAATGTCACSGDPIPTGLRIVGVGATTTVTPYDEHICLQPGCFYYPAGGATYPNGTAPATAGCYAR